MAPPRILAAALALGSALAAPAAMAWEEPARGSELRKDLMAAIRPMAEREFGPPVIFVVRDLRVAGDVGFGALSPMRPGGDPESFLRWWHQQPNGDPNFSADIYVLYRRAGNGGWSVADWSLGAGEVWWATERHCAEFRPVIETVCEMEGH